MRDQLEVWLKDNHAELIAESQSRFVAKTDRGYCIGICNSGNELKLINKRNMDTKHPPFDDNCFCSRSGEAVVLFRRIARNDDGKSWSEAMMEVARNGIKALE
jgi:hypothetical protein